MNTLTSLIPDLYEALDVVSRELVGFIPSVTLDANVSRAALGETVRSPITPASAAEDITPGQLPPDDGDQNIGNAAIVIAKSRAVPFRWTGEEQRGVNHGPGYKTIRRDQIAQSFRTLTNEIEAYIGSTAVAGSRAWGTPGTAPFATSLADSAQARKILADNGAPMGDLKMVIDTTAGANIRSLAQLTKANEAGTTELRAQGTLLELHGFSIRESAGVQLHTAGTGASYVTNGALAVGVTSIPVQTGTGTILAGDVVSFGDGYKYVVASALSGGTLTIAAPGLRKAVASGAAVTLAANYTANVAFSRNAIVLATRAPALPEEGDMADDRVMLVDPRSGLAFEVAMYKQYRRVRYEVAMAYGAANIKPEHTATFMG
ncbi:P22 phage major capsid protein family protein [Robbsia andropogonis]|uniref:P22 phage major capsid protein family protein n=1 Tax=Robbsia andropogonis TaxID=28092 RepID=UPI0020A197A8|nr:P22 phage major capsid protein family protein [Robbsia andropogonis]MCP1119639.1 P22 coat - protein 5 family protein [Robbsia andropogonis]MCP1129622.1 P22 coat - protein 5 family protein [Robbsia andropogonis]